MKVSEESKEELTNEEGKLNAHKYTLLGSVVSTGHDELIVYFRSCLDVYRSVRLYKKISAVFIILSLLLLAVVLALAMKCKYKYKRLSGC